MTTRAELLEYLGRDWDAARRAKDQALGAFVRANGATAAFRIAQGLLNQTWSLVRRQRSDCDDLKRYAERLDRARTRRR